MNNQDSYVIIHEENVKEGKMKNFKLRQSYKPPTPYDYCSIMHYGAYFFSMDKVKFIKMLVFNNYDFQKWFY